MTKPEEERIKAWVYRIWPMRWHEMAPVSDSRAQLLKYALRDAFDDEKLNEIELAIIAQTKHWRAKAKADKFNRLTGIPTLSVWYNQQRYNDEFIDESMVAIKERGASVGAGCECAKLHAKNHNAKFKEIIEQNNRG